MRDLTIERAARALYEDEHDSHSPRWSETSKALRDLYRGRATVLRELEQEKVR